MPENEDSLSQLLKQKASEGRISCEEAWQIAQETGVEKQKVGKAADDLGIRIHSCQLGCF